MLLVLNNTKQLYKAKEGTFYFLYLQIPIDFSRKSILDLKRYSWKYLIMKMELIVVYLVLPIIFFWRGNLGINL